MRKLVAVIVVSLFWFAAAPLSLAANGSSGSPSCGTYEVIAEMLATAKEKRVAVYRSASGNIEVWANKASQTWSVISVTQDGKGACLRATGTGYAR